MKTILLTGASGVLGGALLPRLGGHRVIALTHSRDVPTAESVHGDLSAPLLGLDRAGYAELARRVDLVVHCAAVVDFGAPRRLLREVNLQGTAHVLEFCARAGAELIYVSTAFVARVDLAKADAPNPAHHDSAAGNGDPASDGGAVVVDDGPAARVVDTAAYLDSKIEAEAMVRASSVPTAIARPSVVIGDSATGAISSFQAFYYALEEVLRNHTPVIPAAADTQFDLIPQDLAADALAALAARPIVAADYWLTCGDAALTVRRQAELLRLRARELGIEVPPVEMMPTVRARAMLDAFGASMPEALLRRFAGFTALAAVFEGAPPFPSSLGTIPGGPDAMTVDTAEHAFTAAVDYVARTKLLP